MVLLYFRMLVVDMQGRDHALGDDPGAEPARRGPRSLADNAPGEDEPDLVRAADVEVVADHLLEEDPSGYRLVENLGEGELGLQHRDLIPVAGSVSSAVNGHGSSAVHLAARSQMAECVRFFVRGPFHCPVPDVYPVSFTRAI